MNKTKKLIIIFSVALVIAATILIVTIIKANEDKGNSGEPSVLYTLQPTTAPYSQYDTESWVDINQIAENLASTTDVSGTDTSGVTVSIPGFQGMQVFLDANGNLVDANGNKVNLPQNNQGGQNTNTTKVDNTQAFDDPVENEMGEYQINDKGVITAYYGKSSSVIIPVKVQGKKVTGIGKNCFKDSRIKSINIPDTVTSIGDSAFENCSALTSISFGSNLTKITIGNSAFKNCIALKEITLPAANVGQLAFDNCTALKRVVFSKGTESIGNYCFSNCRSLESVTFPDSTSTFGTQIFDHCDQEKLIVKCPLGSDAENYALEQGFKTKQY